MRRLLTPKLLVLHLLGAVATTAAVLLGLWQYDAWQAGRALAARDLASARPVPLQSVLGPDAAFQGRDVGRPVTLTGQWLPEATVLVADREQEGRDGRWVVTPVAVCEPPTGCGGAPAILVVRGWLGEADAVPPPPAGPVTVTGWLQPGEGSGTPDPDPTDEVLPELRIASAIQHVDQDLYGGYVIADSTGPTTQTDGPAAGLEPVTPESLPEVRSSTSLRNLLYAVEWWAFAGFAGFLWWRWVRDELDDEGTGHVAEGPDPAGSAAPEGGPEDEPDRQPDREDAGIASTS